MSICPLCYHNNINLGSLPILELNTNIYIAYNLSIIKIRGIYYNNISSNSSGIFHITTNYSKSIIISCNIYYNNKHYTSSIIDPLIININNNIKSKEYNENIPYDSLLFKMPYYDCPPYCNITIDVTYIEKLNFTSNGFFQLKIPLKIPSENILPNSQGYSTIKCILDSGTPIVQWNCQTHQLHLMEHTSPFVYPTNPYAPPGTTAVALQSNSIPLSQTSDFVLEYLGVGTNIITGSSLVELPYYPNTVVINLFIFYVMFYFVFIRVILFYIYLHQYHNQM